MAKGQEKPKKMRVEGSFLVCHEAENELRVERRGRRWFGLSRP
ncbi:uncharacterized protein G2W53_009369 [Senna tora]|uniref:Uncharacterized protein n=1 Tax=Senna tora TaxID=362788 RepID=A0A835C9U9_9FABA|nr:uncharacterized protein G2W53_009369 [Senna tora]